MSGQAQSKDAEQTRIVLGLLETLSRDGARSQRHLASELDIALGLVNAYLRRCIKKGLVKVSDVPARRYTYFLTPKGFAEKSRLTVEYFTSSFSFFRQAKADCTRIFRTAEAEGYKRIVLAGKSDLAEVAAICALETGVKIVALSDAGAKESRFLDVPIIGRFEDFDGQCDAVVVTDLGNTRDSYEAAVEWVGVERVLVPAMLQDHIDGHVWRDSKPPDVDS